MRVAGAAFCTFLPSSQPILRSGERTSLCLCVIRVPNILRATARETAAATARASHRRRADVSCYKQLASSRIAPRRSSPRTCMRCCLLRCSPHRTAKQRVCCVQQQLRSRTTSQKRAPPSHLHAASRDRAPRARRARGGVTLAPTGTVPARAAQAGDDDPRGSSNARNVGCKVTRGRHAAKRPQLRAGRQTGAVRVHASGQAAVRELEQRACNACERVRVHSRVRVRSAPQRRPAPPWRRPPRGRAVPPAPGACAATAACWARQQRPRRRRCRGRCSIAPPAPPTRRR
jgi:hypothetical protein